MRSRTIGTVTVSAIGLGGMPMSIEGRPDEERSIATIHAALDAGVTLIDTADAYHVKAGEAGHNERLIAKAGRRPGAHRVRDRPPHQELSRGCRSRRVLAAMSRRGPAGHYRRACHCCRVIAYINHSRSNSCTVSTRSQPTRWKTVRIATLAGSVGASTRSAAAYVNSQSVSSASASRP